MKWACPARANRLASEYSGHALSYKGYGMWECSACGKLLFEELSIGSALNEESLVQKSSIEVLLYQVSVTVGVPRKIAKAADAYRGTNLTTADDVAVLQFLEREGLP